jgi:hypothetical protein
VNPDFIKSNYLTCSNKNVKKTIIKIYEMGYRWLSTTKVAGGAPFRERPTINLYYRYHVVK